MTAPVLILAPGRQESATSGGYLTHHRLSEAISLVADVELVAYDDRDLERVRALTSSHSRETLFLAGWGPHVPSLADSLRDRRFVYWANSVGWFDALPTGVPVLCASRYTFGYWGEVAPDAPLYYLPNPLDPKYGNRGMARDIDVLLPVRKNSSYVLDDLVPALRRRGLKVEVLDRYVEDLPTLLNRSKSFVYDSRDHWLKLGVSEGMGLPPLEALACGCHVFSSCNAGLSDYLDPAFVGSKLSVHSLAHDVERIAEACDASPNPSSEIVASAYRYSTVAERWSAIAADLERYFAFREAGPWAPDDHHRAIRGPLTYQRVRQDTGSLRSWRGVARRMRRAVRSISRG